jgi:hypothetical protein
MPMSLVMLEKMLLLCSQEQPCMMVVLPTTVARQLQSVPSAFTDAWETDANIKYLRYAEVVLMKAEALNELDQTGPIILLNDIRRRAQLLQLLRFRKRRLEQQFTRKEE